MNDLTHTTRLSLSYQINSCESVKHRIDLMARLVDSIRGFTKSRKRPTILHYTLPDGETTTSYKCAVDSWLKLAKRNMDGMR